MRKELMDKIIAYNKAAAERTEKAEDLDVIISSVMKLPPGQLKKVLSDEVLGVLAKYGLKIEE